MNVAHQVISVRISYKTGQWYPRLICLIDHQRTDYKEQYQTNCAPFRFASLPKKLFQLKLQKNVYI